MTTIDALAGFRDLIQAYNEAYGADIGSDLTALDLTPLELLALSVKIGDIDDTLPSLKTTAAIFRVCMQAATQHLQAAL